MLSFIVFVVTFVVAFALLNQKSHKKVLEPPGPMGIPFLGNLLQLGKQPHLQFRKWALEYGNIYKINLAHRAAIVINEAHMAKEIFSLREATGRFQTELFTVLTRGNYGIGHARGSDWVEQRLFCVRALKSLGFDRGYRMEPLILREVQLLCERIEANYKESSEVFIKRDLKYATTNVLWTMITGERIPAQESIIVHLLEEWMDCIQVATAHGLLFFSWLKVLPTAKSIYKRFLGVCEKLGNYVETEFRRHNSTINFEQPPRDLIDAYLEKVTLCHDPHSTFFGNTRLKNSFASVSALMLAGGESSGTVINWMIFYLIAHPQYQQRLHNEIDEVVGRQREPSLRDRNRMPFTVALIYETMRFATLAPFGTVHELIGDIDYRGFKLQKGTLLFQNIYCIHNDVNLWEDPEHFRPERFQNNPDLKEFVFSFQPGKRTCPGDHSAKDIMFLFVVKIFQKFCFMPSNLVKHVTDYLQPDTGYGLIPKNLPVTIKLRNCSRD